MLGDFLFLFLFLEDFGEHRHILGHRRRAVLLGNYVERERHDRHDKLVAGHVDERVLDRLLCLANLNRLQVHMNLDLHGNLLDSVEEQGQHEHHDNLVVHHVVDMEQHARLVAHANLVHHPTHFHHGIVEVLVVRAHHGRAVVGS